ncbi:MAG: DUF6904 family protein [Saccharofermentanales bacterium]
MITFKTTENLTGVSISGDYDDLENLVDAFHHITVDEYTDTKQKYQRYVDISTRVLGLCYDARHAYQGDRDVELVDNGMDDMKKKAHSIIASKKNVYYKFNYLYPEMFFVMIALNELVKVRIRDLTKAKYIFVEVFDKNVIWDETIATIRSFQAGFVKCVKETISDALFSRWMKIMTDDNTGIERIAGQYVDLLNIKYIDMTKEDRLKNFTKIAKQIAEFDTFNDHSDIKDIVVEAAKEQGCSPENIQIKGIEYPEDIAW